MFLSRKINALTLQLAYWCRCLFLLPPKGWPRGYGLRNPHRNTSENCFHTAVHLGEIGLPQPAQVVFQHRRHDAGRQLVVVLVGV